jgi:hypothetical protein
VDRVDRQVDRVDRQPAVAVAVAVAVAEEANIKTGAEYKESYEKNNKEGSSRKNIKQN